MTVDERLRRAHARVPDPDPVTVARARALVTAALDEAPAPHRRPSVAWRLRFVLPTLAVAAAIVVAVVLVVGDAPREREATPPAAGGPIAYQRNTFQSAARYITAEGSPNGNPGNAAYAIGWSVSEEIWRAPDGSGLITYGADSAPFLPSAADERAWRAAGKPDLAKFPGPGGRGPKRIEYGPGELDNALLLNAGFGRVLPQGDPLAAMPSAPRALAAWLDATVARQVPRDVPSAVTRVAAIDDAIALLRDARATQEQRLALIDVLSTLDGARRLASVRDPAGREWPGIEFERQTIAYDPRSGHLMAQGDRFDGGVRWIRTYSVASGGVAAIGERP
jgi:hypothetical protein